MQADIPVKEVMTRDVCTAKKDESLLNASRKMLEYGVGSIIIVENGKPVGIVTERDILKKVVEKITPSLPALAGRGNWGKALPEGVLRTHF